MNKIIWTKENCAIEALKFNSRNEFSIKSNSAYKKSLDNKWDDDICKHMIRIGNHYKKCIYVYEFSDNSAYVGLTYDLVSRNINRKFNNNDAVTIHIKETNLIPKLIQLTDYIDVNIASKLEDLFINEYIKNKWNILNRSKGGAIGGKLKWNYDLCKIEALKCKTRTEFKKKNDSAYKSAKRNGWFNEITVHMTSKIKHWTIQDVKEEASRYSSRYEFSLKNGAAYRWAIRKNILNDICLHMNKNNSINV